MDNTKIGIFLKELRTKKGYTQGDIAQKCSVTNQAVSKWEKGDSIPDISCLNVLSDLYQITINEIIEGEVKISRFNVRIIDIIVSVLALLLCLTLFLPVREIGMDKYSMYQIVTKDLFIGGSIPVFIFILLFISQFVGSVIITVFTIENEEMKRYILILFNVITIILFSIFYGEMSYIVASTRNFMFWIVGLSMVTNVVGLYLGKENEYKYNEVTYRRIVTYVSLVPFFFLAAVNMYNGALNPEFRDAFNILFSSLLLIHPIIGVFLPKSFFENRLHISLYLAAFSTILIFANLLTRIRHNTNETDPAFYIVILILLLPVLIVNLRGLFNIFFKQLEKMKN